MANLITIADFQKQYAVSRSTVYRLSAKGQLPLIRLGRAVRIRQSDVDAWFAKLSDANSAKGIAA